MTRITNAEQVLMLLRAHLQRAEKTSAKRVAPRQGRSGPLDRVQKLASTEGLSEADIARALIAGLLAEEFGPELTVEPRFQAVIEDVRQIIDRDEKGRRLMRRAIAQLSSST